MFELKISRVPPKTIRERREKEIEFTKINLIKLMGSKLEVGEIAKEAKGPTISSREDIRFFVGVDIIPTS